MTSPHQFTDALSTDAEALTDNDVPFVEVEEDLTAKADLPSVEAEEVLIVKADLPSVETDEALIVKAELPSVHAEEAISLSIKAAKLVATAFKKWADEAHPAPPVETMALCMEAAALQRKAASLVVKDHNMPGQFIIRVMNSQYLFMSTTLLSWN